MNNITKTILESLEELEQEIIYVPFVRHTCEGWNDLGEEFIDQALPTLEFRDKVKSHLLQSQIRLLEAVIEGMKKSKKDGLHDFEMGNSFCRFCGEPRIFTDIKRVVLIRDKETGGELAEVTENRIDQTDFPCSNNPKPYYNKALNDQISSLEEVKKELLNN